MNASPEHWTSAVGKAAWTLLVVAVVAFTTWWLLRQLLAPLLVVVAVVAVYRVAIRGSRRNRF